MSSTLGAITNGTLLGGRVRYAQYEAGYRTALEPVLLAASIPARSGDSVLEAGTGAGAGLLCLATRVSGITGLGLERDPALAALAQHNFEANNARTVRAVCADLLTWPPDTIYDHVFANPPWHDAAGTPSPNPGRVSAKQAHANLLNVWTARLAAALKPHGTLSLIVPATNFAAAMHALEAAKCAAVTLLPLWPRAGTPAKLAIIRGVRLGRGPCSILPGLTLHEPASGAFTPAADDVLRAAAALPASAKLAYRAR